MIFFYSNEHEPVHVHGRYQEFESKIEFVIDQGQVKKIVVRAVAGKKPLPKKQLASFKELAGKLADEIVQNWINYFVLHKQIVSKKIDGKL